MTNEEFLATIEPHVETRSYAHAEKLVSLYDQVDCLLDKARKVTLSSAYIDEREQWLVSESYFQEVQKAFDGVKR